MDNIIAENLLLVCSICLDSITEYKERSVAKLKYGHVFHLDCIGSTFNVKGAMVCPNCRQNEAGQWLYANSSTSPLVDSHFIVDDETSITESQYRLYEVQSRLAQFQSSRLPGGHPSFGQLQSSPTRHRELPAAYVVSSEHMVAPHLAYSHVHFPPFFGAIFGASYQGWGDYSTPISAEGDHLNVVDNALDPSTFGTARVDNDAISRHGLYVLPSIYGDTLSPSGGILFVSSISHMHPGHITFMWSENF